MGAPSLPKTEVLSLIDAGLSNLQIAEHLRREGLPDARPEAVGMIRHRAGRGRQTPSRKATIPWMMQDDADRHSYTYTMLRFYDKRLKGEPLNDRDTRALNGFVGSLQVNRQVVTYVPTAAPGTRWRRLKWVSSDGDSIIRK